MKSRLSLLLGCFCAMLTSGSLWAGSPKTLADVGTTGISGEPNVGLIARGDGTYALVFTNAQTTTFTFNSPWTVKEFLVVGGGGAGGGNGGAGGGGGGVIYYTEDLIAADNLKTNYVNGEKISIKVGAGGTGAFKATGVPGTSSSVTFESSVYTAFGGAGGGNYDDLPSVDRNAAAGVEGTGCGAAGYADGGTGVDTTMATNKPGYYANNSGIGVKSGNYSYCAGGGGAGEVGGDAVTPSTGTKMGGKGGDGLRCLITGTEVYYAAGGGGSTSNSNTTELSDEAEGGRGGGGHASAKGSRVNNVGIAPSDPSVHASGFGCGGGGGGGGSGACCFGGNGSAGIVVLLIEPIEVVSEKPIVSSTIAEQGANYVKFSVSVVADGLDNATQVQVWGGWAKDGVAIEDSLIASEVAVNGQVNPVITGLEVGSTYNYRFYAVNRDSVSGDAVEGSFTLESGGVNPESGVPVITNQACTVLGTSVTVLYCVAWPGAGKETCSVSLKYGLMEDRLSYTVDLGAGLIGNNQTQVTGLIPGRKYYFRLAADNGTTQGVSEIFTAIIGDEAEFPQTFDARQPVIAGVGGSAGFVAGGSGLIYSGAFSNYVAGTVVTFHYSPDGGDTWLMNAATVTSDGFSGSVVSGLTPATDIPYYFTAIADDFADCTQEKTFNTKGSANLGNYLESAFYPVLRIPTVTANVSDLGAGTNAVICLIAKVGDTGDWVELSTNQLTQAGSVKVTCSAEAAMFFEFGTYYRVSVIVRNTAFDGTVWTSEITAEKEWKHFTPSDDAVYTWINGEDGLWSEPTNWTPSKIRETMTGYPVYGSTVKFADGVDKVTLHVTGEEGAKLFNASNLVYLCLQGDADGAAVNISSQSGNDSFFLFDDAGARLVLDGVAVRSAYGVLKLKGVDIEFAGDNAALAVSRGVVFAEDVERNPLTLAFDIPQEGYVEAPLQLGSGVFPSTNDVPVTVEVRRRSRFLRRPEPGSQLLINAAGGVNTNCIEFASVYEDRGRFRYEWPAKDPNHTGRPTELWFDVDRAPVGMKVIIR